MKQRFSDSEAVGRGISFEDWCKRLNNYHEAQRAAGIFEGYGPGLLTEITGAECWHDYYVNDYSPEDALEEDRGYWE